MSGKMKAAVMTKIREVEIQTIDIPTVDADEVLIKVAAVGVCGSDVHYYESGRIGDFIVEKPIILGHELAGEIVEIGKNVKNVTIGDRVAVEPGVTCGRCEYCKEGRYNLCPDVVFYATPPVDGAFCEYVKIRQDFAFKIPESLSCEEAAMIEPFSVGIHAANRTGVKTGQTVAILGMGPVGLLAVVAAKEYGASQIIVTDLEPKRLEIAKKLGATDTINIRETDATDAIKQLTGGKGVDVAWETAGHPSALKTALASVRRGGKVGLVGMPKELEIPINIHTITGGEVDIVGIFRYCNTYPTAVKILSSGKYDIQALMTHSYSLDDTQAALEEAMTNKSEAIKVVVYPQK